MLFERCYVSNSICGPMRAVIQTGKYTHKSGFFHNNNKFDGTQQTLPKLLQKAGYQTAVIGKWHLGSHMAPQGYNYSEVLIGQGPYYNPPMLRDANGDGIPNGISYIFGDDGVQFFGKGMLSAPPDAIPNDVDLTLFYSTDLQSWTPLLNGFAISNGILTDLSNDPKRFYRYEAQLLP